MMAHRSAKNLALIRDLCKRLGFSYDSEQLNSDGGLQSLLPQIQERLNQLREEDTYGDVEEIPTDSCSVVFAAPPKPRKSSGRAIHGVLSSIVQSMVSTQLQLSLVAQTLASFEAAEAPSSSVNATSSTCVDESLNPLLTEIRTETLLKVVLLSVLSAATEAANEGSARACASFRPDEASRSASNATDFPKNSSDSGRTESTAASAAASSHGRRSAVVSSGTSGAFSATGSRSSALYSPSAASRGAFSGFPCYPSPLVSAASSQSHAGHGKAQVRETGPSSRPRVAAAAAATAAATVVRGRLSYRETSWRQLDQQLLSSSDAQPANAEAREAYDARHGVWMQQTGEAELISYSNMEARWRGRRMAERRREFCWPVEDVYLRPYEGSNAVARDGWQFAVNRPGVCPADAQVNRTRRADMMADRHRRESRRRGAANRRVPSPLELQNGVMHPLGPPFAPCTAAFFGE